MTKKKLTAKYRSQSGVSMIQVMVAISVFSVIIFSISNMILNSGARQVSAIQISQIDLFRRNLMHVAADSASWQKTIRAAQNQGSGTTKMECLVNGTPCTVDGTGAGVPISGQAFALVNRTGEIVFDSTSTTAGVTGLGTLCNAYSSTGNDACPFRFELIWRANCVAGACVNPQVRVTATLVYTPINVKTIINPATYGVPSMIPGTL